MNNSKFEFDQLEALSDAVRIAKRAAINTISSERVAHLKAYNIFLYLSERFNTEFADYNFNLQE